MRIKPYLLSILLIVSCAKNEEKEDSQNNSSDLNSSEFSAINGTFVADYRSITANKFGYRLKCVQNAESIECSNSKTDKLILTSKIGYIARYNIEIPDKESCEYYEDIMPHCKNDVTDLNNRCYIPYEDRCIINGYSIGYWGTHYDKHGDIKLILKFAEDSNEIRTYSKE